MARCVCTRAAVSAALGGVLVTSVSLPAMAQGVIPMVIGSTIGNMVAAEREAALEKACMAGEPLAEPQRAQALWRIQALMDDYRRLSPGQDRKGRLRLFSMKSDDVSWRMPDGPVGPEAVRARLSLPPSASDPVAPTSPPAVVQVAGDGMSAIAVWGIADPSATGAAPATGDRIGVDFTYDKNPFWGGQWKIRHMRLFVAPDAPAWPQPYCHFGQVLAAVPATAPTAPTPSAAQPPAS